VFRRLFPNLAQMDGGKLMMLPVIVPAGIVLGGVILSDLGAALGFAYGDRLEAQLESPYE
jgi:hypothetical protein